jgi:hypothetical protein
MDVDALFARLPSMLEKHAGVLSDLLDLSSQPARTWPPGEHRAGSLSHPVRDRAMFLLVMAFEEPRRTVTCGSFG